MARPWCLWAALPCLAALAGWPGVPAAEEAPMSDVRARIGRVLACLTPAVVRMGAPLPCRTLRDRMASDGVPALGVAVIRGGAIDWAAGFGTAAPGGRAVTAGTLFQAGSIGKPGTALAALRLVEAGRLSLDADVGRAAVAVDPAMLETYAGVHDLGPGVEVEIAAEGGGLTARLPGRDPIPLFPVSPTAFLATTVDAEVEFFARAGDPHLVLRRGGRTLRAERRR